MPIHDNDFSEIGAGREEITPANQVPQAGDSEGVLLAKGLGLLASIAGNTEAPAAVTAGHSAAVIASTDGTPSLSKAANTHSAVSAVPTSAAGQFTVSIGGDPAITWPAGQSYQWDSGAPDVLNANTIVFTVTAGSVVFILRTP